MSLVLTDSAALQCDVAQRHCQAHTPSSQVHKIAARGDGKCRIGYLSSDLKQHPVGSLITPVLEAHDSSLFHVTAYSTGKDDASEIRQRIEAAVDVFHDASAWTDEQLVKQIQADGIELLVDLNGHTSGKRLAVLACKPAPVQIGFLGYLGTHGASWMDYLITDRWVLPEPSAAYVVEEPLYLDHCYMPFDTGQSLHEESSRQQQGLPEEGLVFCCLNNPFKYSAEQFDQWLGFLRRFEGSVLWLPEHTEFIRQSLREQTKKRGIDPVRLIFAPRTENKADYLSRYRLADIFLDTFPYNGHTICLEALWAGCPVVTRRGESMASRVASSFLHTLRLPELIADSAEQYRHIVETLAGNPEELQQLKQKLLEQRSESPLFNMQQYMKNYEQVLMRAREGPVRH